MLNGIMTTISVLTLLGGAYIIAESFMSDSAFMRIHRRTDALWVAFCNGIAKCLGAKPYQSKLSAYERDSKKYASTLPVFSAETERIMRREGHLPKDYSGGYPSTTVQFQGGDTLCGEKPSEYMRRRYGQIASVKPNNETEAMRQMWTLQDKVRKLKSTGVNIGYGSHPMDKRDPISRSTATSTWLSVNGTRAATYAPRIVREVVEAEEIEITSKSSAEVAVKGFERRYYEPIEEPDIARILLDD